MDYLEKGVHFIGALDYNRKNQESVYINKRNLIQFAIKSQEETSFQVREIRAFPKDLINFELAENEQMENEERIHNATESLKDKLFLFFNKPRNEGENLAWEISVTKQPKCYNPKESFAIIPVFAGKDDTEECAWNEERSKKGIRALKFDREYGNLSEWKYCVNKGRTLGRFYGKIDNYWKHPFVLWREEGKLYAIGPVKQRDNDRGFALEGNVNRVICITDAFDKIVYDATINPTLAYVPLPACRLLEETLENMEDSDDVLYLNIAENKAESDCDEDITMPTGKHTLERKIQYIGRLDYNRDNQASVWVNSLNYLQFFIKSQEESSFRVRRITSYPNRLLNTVIEEEAHLDEVERIQTATEYLKDKLFVFTSKPRDKGGVSAWDVYVTEQPKYSDEKDLFATIPVFAGKDDVQEATWNEERAKNGIDTSWDFGREYKTFSEWKELVNNGKPLGKIYGKRVTSAMHPFVLWSEEKKLYAVGPVENYQYADGWLLKGNTNRVICIEDALDGMVYDTKINPSLAFVPLSVCSVIEETLKNMEDSDDILNMKIADNTPEEPDCCENTSAPVDGYILDRGVLYIGALDYDWKNQPSIYINNLNKLLFYIRSQEEQSIHVKSIISYPERLLNAVIDEDGNLENEVRIHAAAEYLKDKLFVFFSKPQKKGGNTAWDVYVTERPKCYNPREPFAMIPVFAGKDDAEDLGRLYGRIKNYLNHSFVCCREEGKLYAIGPINQYDNNKGWIIEGNTRRVICMEDAFDNIVYDVEINPTLAYVPLSVCSLLEETLENMEDSDDILTVNITETMKEKLINIPVFAGKNDIEEAEWIRKSEEQEEKKQLNRGYENFIEWKEYVKEGKGVGNTYGCGFRTYARSFVLWREEGQLYAVGPVENGRHRWCWGLKGSPVYKIHLKEFTDNIVYDAEANPTVAQLPLSECKLIEEKLEEMKKEEEKNPHAEIPVFAGKNDAEEAEWSRKKEERGEKGWQSGRGYENFSEWESRVNEGKDLGRTYGINGKAYNKSFVLWREEGQLYAVGPVENNATGGTWNFKGTIIHKVSLSELTDKVIYDTGENPTIARLPLSECKLIEEKFAAMKVEMPEENPEIEEPEEEPEVEPQPAPKEEICEKPKMEEQEEYMPVPVFAGKDEREESTKDVIKVNFSGAFCNSLKSFQNYSFVLWHDGQTFYATGPIQNYEYDNDKGWILEGDTKKEICITDDLDKIVYDAESNPSLAFIPLSVYHRLEDTLKNMIEPEKEKDQYVDIPVFAGKKDPVEVDGNKKRVAEGKIPWDLRRDYVDFSAWEQCVRKGTGIGNTYGCNRRGYKRSFVIWREDGILYAVGPIANLETTGGWRLKGNSIRRIRLSELTDNVIYDTEENPTLAKLPASKCKLIEEMLAYINVPVFAGKNDIEEKEWVRKRVERGETQYNLGRGYANYTAWLEYIKEKKIIGKVFGSLAVPYGKSFVLWREAGELYAAGPVEGDMLKGQGWKLQGDSIQRILLSELTDKVIYDVEENPTLAKLPAEDCKLIEEKLVTTEIVELPEEPEVEPQPAPKEEICEKPKAVTGVRRIHTSRDWKYSNRNWGNR